MTRDELAIYRECTGRSSPPKTQAEEAWLICGRRSGKSFVLSLIASYLGTFIDWRPYLAIGEVATIPVIAKDRAQARAIIRYIEGLLTVPLLARMVVARTRSSFTLDNRVVIKVHSASFKSVRGYTVPVACCDEIAYWPSDETAADPDIEVLNAMRPAMATIHGSLLLVASSPYARRGTLFEAFETHWGHDGDPILVWRATTRTMNSTVKQSTIDRAIERDAARANAEYLAEWRDDVERFVSRAAVLACVTRGVSERPLKPSVKYVAFADPSGGSGATVSRSRSRTATVK